MREILFRGKRKDIGEWIEGIYSPLGWDIFDAREENAYIIAISDNKRYDGVWFVIDPETVGQYTGLTDRNGVRIFEGDILHFINTYNGMNDEWLCAVEFYEGAFVCRYVETGEIEAVEMGVWNHFDSWNAPLVQWDVIGNIHDNPELLKGEE